MIYKIFTKILSTEYELALNSAQRREQAGFWSGFITTDYIQTIKELREKHKEYNLYLCLAFIAYKKLLGWIYTPIAVKSLEDNDMNKIYVNTIRRFTRKQQQSRLSKEKRRSILKVG